MPISVKNDIKKAYGFGNSFSLGDTPVFIALGGGTSYFFRDVKGSYLSLVKPIIADQNWDEFYSSWDVINANRDIVKTTSSKFNLLPSEEPIFDDLWPLLADSLNYANDNDVKDDIEDDINEAYELVAKIAAGTATFDDKPTLNRRISRHDDSFVIFSDLHITAYDDNGLDTDKPNYFDKFNYKLYADVLRTYYATRDFCLVENGDVEECIISQFTPEEAENRKNTAKGKSAFPIANNNDKWDAFLAIRYAKREDNLDDIIDKYQDYYDIVRDEFISKGKYVKITGNHDTYIDGKHESELKEKIEDELNSNNPDERISVVDVLTIKRNNDIKYVVLHGHQFDTQSIQHGDVPYAKSIGDVNSECAAWCNEGADRVWELDDTKRWYIGNSVYPENPEIETKGNFRNVLARETPFNYDNGDGGAFDMLAANTDQIKDDPKGFVETVMGHEIAWEYFENSDNGFNALALEYLTGDEGLKLRHMNEIDLCKRYASEFLNLQTDISVKIPSLILGHTHEPRQNAVEITVDSEIGSPTFGQITTTPYYWYLNTGSAGRYENLIWCIEITTNSQGVYEDKICSWSRVDGKLKKIIWKSHSDIYGSRLIHNPDIPAQIFEVL